MRAKEILDFVGDCIRMPTHSLPDGGFITGSPNDKVKGILVTWMTTLDALKMAIRRGHNVIVCHECMLFHEIPQGAMFRWTSPSNEKPSERPDHPNQLRLQLIARHHLTILQIHYGLDRMILYDAFMKQLGITRVTGGSAYEQVYELAKPMKAADLCRMAMRKLGLSCVRFSGNPNKLIRRVGNAWGGVGLFSNLYWIRKQIENGAEAVITGEACEFTMIFAREYANTVVIETSHAVSENIGMKQAARLFKKRFSDVPVAFYEVKRPYSFIRR